MPSQCSPYVGNDRVSAETKEKGIFSFHYFPEGPERGSLWIKAVRRVDWSPSPHIKLCSEHFCPEDFVEWTSTWWLQKEAMPSAFSAFPSYFQQPQVRHRTQQRRELPHPLPAPVSTADLVTSIQMEYWYACRKVGRLSSDDSINLLIPEKFCLPSALISENKGRH